MAGHADPPEGAPGGAPGAGDEYQSTVFDESFVRAAHLQEYSAQERLEDHTTAVRSRPAEAPEGPAVRARAVPKQGIALALIILMAFAAAIYLGGENPYQQRRDAVVEPPATALVPLAPEGEVPGAAAVDVLYAESPAGEFGVGAGGVALPDPRATAHFSSEQVLTALTLAKEYVVASAMTADVLNGATAEPVRELLVAQQQEQLERALAGSSAQSPVTGWLVRFDPEQTVLADARVRVDGTFTFAETTQDVLEVVGRHVFAYAVRGAEAPGEPVALFTVHREVRLQFGEQELREREVTLRGTETLAGPMDCAVAPGEALRPLLAGETAAEAGPVATDPYAVDADRQPVCGTLAAHAAPGP